VVGITTTVASVAIVTGAAVFAAAALNTVCEYVCVCACVCMCMFECDNVGKGLTVYEYVYVCVHVCVCLNVTMQGRA